MVAVQQPKACARATLELLRLSSSSTLREIGNRNLEAVVFNLQIAEFVEAAVPAVAGLHAPQILTGRRSQRLNVVLVNLLVPLARRYISGDGRC